MQEVPHSVHGCTHKAKLMSSLHFQRHELLFISPDFMVKNDYGFQGCMMNTLTRLWIHIHDNMLWVLSL